MAAWRIMYRRLSGRVNSCIRACRAVNRQRPSGEREWSTRALAIMDADTDQGRELVAFEMVAAKARETGHSS